MICLNSRQAAEDLLERRGSNYCDRPRFTLFEIMGWGLTLTFLRYGPRFSLHRRLFQTTFSRTNVRKFEFIQQHEARKTVRNLLQDPADWKDITLLMATSIIFRIAFGQEVVDKDSPYCAMSQAANYATTAGGTPGLSASIVSARLMSTLSASAPVILSAIERWQELWDRETTRLGPEKVRASGLFRHSGGVAWLVRRSVEVSIGNGKQCAYTRGVDHDSLKELHDFLQMCRDT
ncbi:hypothetical protein BN1723_017802 [Verticillium longisporum]|uniref:Uncharacterized protein n=1 Tax=Verticillium longisporum TaxID=100787 RepID=A0A0G4LCC3_VERLO|nr:hypothetical protein BN1723_017802 [Verticillium longisporum]